MGRYWWIKIIALCLALAGVVWTMSALKSGSYTNDPNGPVQVLLGGQAGSPSGGAAQPSAGETEGIHAKVMFQEPQTASSATK